MILWSIPVTIILSVALSTAITKLVLDRKFQKTREAVMKKHTAFVSAASHELRTPLSNILGLVNNLQSEYQHLSAQGQKNFLQLNNSSSEMHKTLIDVLEIFELSDKGIELNNSAFNIQKAVKDTVDGVKRRLKGKQADLRFVVSVSDDIWVDADPVRFRQCLDTLLNQAAYQTKNGTISVEISHQSQRSGDFYKLKIVVADDSSGMDQYKADKYFEPEHYEMNPSLRGRPSAMLAINLAKGILEHMGGSIEAVSKVGSGVTFNWRMQASIPDTVPEPLMEAGVEELQSLEHVRSEPSKPVELPEGALNGANILIVDDNEINLMVLEGFIEKFNPEKIVKASGGYEAVDLAMQNSFDLVLMDIQMPDLDGIESTKKIRAIDSHYAYIPIVAISAGSKVENVPKCKAAGMSGYIEKPLSREALEEALSGLQTKIHNTIQKRAA